ncbi:MAG: 2-isopropylmalate synthase [Lentisphaeria bacterium]|jgi:2-isopropylmalate synthase
MSAFDHRKYAPFEKPTMPHRLWPNRTLVKAPQWCSVDLRDGNQALIEPMNSVRKREMFDLLVRIGFKQIEVGFPAASATDYEFIRTLIESDLIPGDVTIQVLTQARQPLIERTFESLKGCKRAIVHLYNSTSRVQREHVFCRDRQGIIDIAVDGARAVLACAKARNHTDWQFQYSPESFTGTELDFAVEICDAVVDVWQPAVERPVIINLPATVEMSTPNIFADQIEWFCTHVAHRETLSVSVHTHNDRGCAVAAAELAVLAGADRVEGTLFGNGERTGNVDIVTMAMNLYSQGIDPHLNFANMDDIARTVTTCTQLPLHPRHPYAGELVFTAFSGSHQDAIKKCLARRQTNAIWDVAYLPIDPSDLGRSYEEVIRINSQSGKGGVAYVLQRDHGIELPRWLQIEFSGAIQRTAEDSETEVSARAIWHLFDSTYLQPVSDAETAILPGPPESSAWQLHGYQLSRVAGREHLKATIAVGEIQRILVGDGLGVVDAFVNALSRSLYCHIALAQYSEHILNAQKSDNHAGNRAIAFVQLCIAGRNLSGVGVSADIIEASFTAILRAASKAQNKRKNIA